jgi:hypothetical protein
MTAMAASGYIIKSLENSSAEMVVILLFLHLLVFGGARRFPEREVCARPLSKSATLRDAI